MNLSGLMVFLVFFSQLSFSQETLEIYFTRFGALKKYQLHEQDVLWYKVKGKKNFHKRIIANLHDSTIYFSDDTTVKISDLKCIRFQRNNHLITTFEKAFIIAGVGLASLKTVNGLILDKRPLLNTGRVVVSASFVAAGLILKRMSFKRIRLSKKKTIKLVDLNFRNLNSLN